MGALSHSLLYQISFMEVAVWVPDGVEYPAFPVETGHSYFVTPSRATVILCLDLSMVTWMVEAALWLSNRLSEPEVTCALAGLANITAKTGTIRPQKCRADGRRLDIASSLQGLLRLRIYEESSFWTIGP